MSHLGLRRPVDLHHSVQHCGVRGQGGSWTLTTLTEFSPLNTDFRSMAGTGWRSDQGNTAYMWGVRYTSETVPQPCASLCPSFVCLVGKPYTTQTLCFCVLLLESSPKGPSGFVATLWTPAMVHDRLCFSLAQTKMSWRACSLYSTRDNPPESRFRAAQYCDDPTVAVVADLTRSED